MSEALRVSFDLPSHAHSSEGIKLRHVSVGLSPACSKTPWSGTSQATSGHFSRNRKAELQISHEMLITMARCGQHLTQERDMQSPDGRRHSIGKAAGDLTPLVLKLHGAPPPVCHRPLATLRRANRVGGDARDGAAHFVVQVAGPTEIARLVGRLTNMF